MSELVLGEEIPNDVYLKMSVEQRLNMVNYDFIGYVPSDEALFFVNFIKEVNGGEEENETPVVHLVMMDSVFNAKRRCAILVFRGAGKLQSGSSMLLSDNGWITMNDVKVGSVLFGMDGKKTKVTHKTEPQYPQMYKMTLSDGTVLEVGDKHNHQLVNSKGSYSVKTTDEIYKAGLTYDVKERISSRSPKNIYKFKIPLCEPIEMDEIEVEIHPYVMGYGIANGYFNKSVVSTHIDDSAEIMQYFSEYGQEILSHGSNGVNAYRFKTKGNIYKKYQALSKMKSIPHEYKFNSIQNRIELLRGLMDGDGTICENGSCRYSTFSLRLALDVQELVQSLGGIATVKKYNSEYVVRIKIQVCPFKLKRKVERWKPAKIKTKAIIGLEKIECKEAGYCIVVDNASHTYITEGYTVTHNTTLFGEYLILFIAAFGKLPGFGKVNLMLYVTDSIENGVKNLRRNVEFRYSNSEFLRKMIPNKKLKVGNYDTSQWVDMSNFEEESMKGEGGIKFTDIRLEFENNKGHKLVVKGYGAKALSLDTRLYKKDGYTTIKECLVGEEIYGSDGKLAKITAKSEIFNKPMYKIELDDGRFLKVSEDHINSVMINITPNGTAKWVEKDLTTLELLNIGWIHTKLGNKLHKGISNKCIMKIKNIESLEYEHKHLAIDPYTLGLILGDGSVKKQGSGIVITGLLEDCETYVKHIPYNVGDYYLDKRTKSVVTFAIKGINKSIRDLKLDVHGNYKFIPEEYYLSSSEQRLELLKGLLDTDGTISNSGRISFCSSSKKLADDVIRLVRSLGGKSKMIVKKTDKGNQIYVPEIWIGVNPFKLSRKSNRYIENKIHWNNVNVVGIYRIDDEPSQCIAVDNENHQFVAGQYLRTHNTGVRGAKEMGQRPSVALLDDLLSDEDARSPTIISSIEDTIYKAVSKALHPTRQKIIWLGTPFNQKDPLYKAVESGAWNVSCFPICEWFDENTTEEKFKGAWSDRFPYKYVKAEFDEAKSLGRLHDFYQELMLRIMSEDERLVLDSDIFWYKRNDVLKNKDRYNWYITTDFATSEKTSADFSVISVWAYNNNGDWLWVDGIVKRQLMDKNVSDLFKLVQKYKPMSVGIEISGQQGGFVSWVKNEMIQKNIYFNLARNEGSNKEGLMPNTNKLVRFNTVVPLFKAGKIWLPEEMKNEEPMIEAMNEIRGASMSGFKSKHDDWLDTVSMLSLMNAFKPSVETEYKKRYEDDGIYVDVEPEDDNNWTGRNGIF